jgi:aminodeoxyfutalosine deaminase
VSANKLLRARIVLPITTPPIENGTVEISGNRIVRVGRWNDFSASRQKSIDLGEAILFPGLVNAHCHFDYTDMAGQFLPPKSFTDWIKLITAAKGGWTYSDFAHSWLNGANMLLRSGTTCVADFENAPELLPEIWDATPLRVFSFLEMTGVKSRRDPKMILADAVKTIDSFGKSSRCVSGFAPHAPYSTLPELLRLSAQTASDRKQLLSIHVSESAEEFDMFTQSRGVMFKWLKKSERPMSDCGYRSPVRHLEKMGVLGKNLLAVHVNYLAHGDAKLLAQKGVSVVHCSRSHDFFSHCEFPFNELTKAGVNICLGTDSLATVKKSRGKKLELSLFSEMRAFAKKKPAVSAETILQMATVNGARALHMSGKIGELAPDAYADLITIPFCGNPSGAFDALIQHKQDVSASMIDGQWALQPSK